MPAERDPTSTLRQDRSLATAHAFRLAVVEGADAGASVVLDLQAPGRTLVGTSRVCTLVLRDRYVSRRHVGVDMLGEQLRLSDLGSVNGTFVNGVRVVECVLFGGELVRVGQTTLRADPLEAPSSRVPAGPTSFGRALGRSAEMRAVFRMCEELARTDLPFVIEGETGTGKDLVAEAIHAASARAQGPFVVFDGSTVPTSLVESTLFGCEAGALAGVTEARAGLFEQADGGTLLVDEPALLDLEAQRKLVRAVESGELRRVGSDRARKVNLRVLATSTLDLDKAVEDGRLRDDLFYRLAGARIELPPLRRRREDVALLARHFWSTLGGKGDLPSGLLERFEAHGWPGNVRELENAVALHLVTGEMSAPVRGRAPSGDAAATGSQAPPPMRDVVTEILDMDLPFPKARQRVVAELERAYVSRLLAKHGGNVSRASAASGIGHRYFQMLKAKHKG